MTSIKSEGVKAIIPKEIDWAKLRSAAAAAAAYANYAAAAYANYAAAAYAYAAYVTRINHREAQADKLLEFLRAA